MLAESLCMSPPSPLNQLKNASQQWKDMQQVSQKKLEAGYYAAL